MKARLGIDLEMIETRNYFARAKGVSNIGYSIDRHQRRPEGRTRHEVTEIVIFEAMAAMHHATSTQVQNAGI